MTKLPSLLLDKEAAILKRWVDLVIDTYPAETARLFKQSKDRFANPVGYSISTEMQAIYDGLVRGSDTGDLYKSLENVVRLRAVQDFCPSEAVSFIFLLKKAVREQLGDAVIGGAFVKELAEFEYRIDKVALMTFDIYMQSLLKIKEIQVNQIKAEKDRLLMILERANLFNNNLGEGDTTHD